MHAGGGMAGGTGIHPLFLGYSQLRLSQSPAEYPCASFGEELPMLTHLGMGHAEPFRDASCKQGFACSTLQRQSLAAGVSPGLLAPVFNRAGALGCGARSYMGSAEEGSSTFWGTFTPASSDQTHSVSVTLAGRGTLACLNCMLCS